MTKALRTKNSPGSGGSLPADRLTTALSTKGEVKASSSLSLRRMTDPPPTNSGSLFLTHQASPWEGNAEITRQCSCRRKGRKPRGGEAFVLPCRPAESVGLLSCLSPVRPTGGGGGGETGGGTLLPAEVCNLSSFSPQNYILFFKEIRIRWMFKYFPYISF